MTKKLFVGGLPYSVTNTQLQDLFAQAGNVVSATVITDKFTGQSKGFGFVEMETEEEAQNAQSKIDGTDYEGRTIHVNEAKPQEPRNDNRGFSNNRGYDRDRRNNGDRGGDRRNRW